ncbi:MAG: hypothetical protein HY673_23835 [Chloroflexi bacterium]|nr:hypothetical protein [Chloroflexota bacterium]
MAQSKISVILAESMSRREFLRGSVGAGLVVVAAGAAATSVLAACAPAPPTADIRVTSSTDFNHSHNVTVPGADVDSAPSQKTYTSDGASHTHDITLTRANFEAIKKGETVTVTSTATGANQHTHTFAIKKA